MAQLKNLTTLRARKWVPSRIEQRSPRYTQRIDCVHHAVESAPLYAVAAIDQCEAAAREARNLTSQSDGRILTYSSPMLASDRGRGIKKHDGRAERRVRS